MYHWLVFILKSDSYTGYFIDSVAYLSLSDVNNFNAVLHV